MIRIIKNIKQWFCCPHYENPSDYSGRDETKKEILTADAQYDYHDSKPQVEEVYVEFVATIKVPSGFVLKSKREFRSELQINQEDLTYQLLFAPCCSGKSIMPVHRHNIQLQGVYNYNVVLNKFIPACAIEDVNTVADTVFSTNGTIYIDKKLRGHIGETFGEKDYTLDVKKNSEFIVLNSGTIVTRKSKDFFKILENPDSEKMICVPYTLKIKVLPN